MTKTEIDIWVDWIQWQVKQTDSGSVNVEKKELKKIIYALRRLKRFETELEKVSPSLWRTIKEKKKK